jgi:hypothetical protein
VDARKEERMKKEKKLRVCYCTDVTTTRIAAEYGREAIVGSNCWCSDKKGKAFKKVGDIALKRKMFKTE